MAREILFRAKRLDDGKWVEGHYQKRYDEIERERHYIFWCESNIVWEYAEIDKDTICQYTGLTDNNGDKIWENDIIGFEDVISYDNGYIEYYCRGQVVWDEETASFQVTERLSCESYEALMECDVIGNIFDNPELLEVLS